MINEGIKLSGYILTLNSEKYLNHILTQMVKVCDEILLIDSGSNDNTKQIAENFGAKIIYKPFENYTVQRNFAHSQCQYENVFWLDSDEIPSLEMIDFILSEKQNGFQKPIYSFRRLNFVLGKRVQVFYPVYDPEYRERICKSTILYESHLTVHETLDSRVQRFNLEHTFDHYTFETFGEIKSKLIKYAKLYAKQNNAKRKPWKMFLSPWAAWFKWYILKGGIKDGRIGFLMGVYTFIFTFLKYYYAATKRDL